MNAVVMDTTVLSQGIEAANNEGADELTRLRYQQEEAQITRWYKELDNARDFDKLMREGYARDRLSAKCATAHEVRVPLIGTSIDTMRSFLYARDPSIDCAPAPVVEAPVEPMPQPPQQPAGLQGLMADPASAIQVPGAVEALQSGGIQGAAEAVGFDVARQQAEYQQALAEYNAKLAEWQAKQTERRLRKREQALFAQTMEIVLTKMWKRARMKQRARKCVVSALTIGIGWSKISWQERTITDPVQAREIQDLRTLLARIDAEEQQMAEGDVSEETRQALQLSIKQQLEAAQAGAVSIIQRGLSVEFVPGQNMQVPTSVEIQDYLDGEWLCEFIYMRLGDARVQFPDIPKGKLDSAQRYQKQRGPDNGANSASNRPSETLDAKDSEVFVELGVATGVNYTNVQPSDDDFVQIAEVWSQDDQNVYTMIRGVKCYPKPPAPPNTKSERFYCHFALSLIDEDGERAPASMTARSTGLQDEYNGRRSALKIARQRAKPGILFDQTGIGTEGMEDIKKSESQEFTGIRTVGGQKSMSDLFTAKPVSPIEPSLYDTSPILRDFERVWGTQEALSGSVEVDKTATEADIQQTGFRSRTGDMRDQLEEWLTDQASYSAVVAKQHLTLQDVMALAGPEAVWPDLEDEETLEVLLNTNIRAGSTGKPNSAKEREAWAAIAPMLTEGAQIIGAARGSSPQEVADKQEAILQETANRAGDGSIDIAKFIPQNEGMLGPGGMPGQPPMPGATPEPAAPIPPSPVEPV
jgi:hypothetical protein